MPTRTIVAIDESLCDGCGQCIPNCAEGALRVVDGKARLVSESYCDGLGACLGHCPRGAIRIVKREAPSFDEEAVKEHLSSVKTSECGCPASSTQMHKEPVHTGQASIGSALRHWPVQLRLVSVKAPFFDGAELLVLADCVSVAYPNLHGDLLKSKAVVMGCPKFDDARGYAEKLGEILRMNDIRGVTVAVMEVPCCGGLRWAVDRALEASGKSIPVRQVVITVKGEIKEDRR